MIRQHSQPNPYASNSYGSRRDSTSGGLRMPRIFKRIFKFPQMDFEVAVWEMTSLMISPKKVFRNMYYHKQTKNTYTSSDPAFPYLLSFFLLLTSLAWSLAYAAPSAANILRIALFFVVVHCLAASLIVGTIMYLAVTRLLGPGGVLVKAAGKLGLGGRRGRGLFATQDGAGEELEWGYCFDVAVRSFFPLWVYLYVVQFLLLPAVTSHRWLPTFLSNTLHAVAFSHSLYVTFLGYSSLPFLSSTHLILSGPLIVLLVTWLIACITGWSASLHLAPILWCWGGLRGGGVGGAAAAAAAAGGST